MDFNELIGNVAESALYFGSATQEMCIVTEL